MQQARTCIRRTLDAAALIPWNRRFLPAALAGLIGAFALVTLLTMATAASAAPGISSPATSSASAGAASSPKGLPTIAPAPSPVGSTPASVQTGVNINLGGSGKGSGLSSPLTLVLLLGLMSVIPALLIMVTAFTRIVIVLGFTRSALSANGIPPNQVVIGLALFLTLFVMGPVISQANHDAIQPLLKGKITQSQAFDRGIQPFRTFMLKQVREKDLGLFVKLSGKPKPANVKELPTTTIIPAFVLSELRASFLIGFIIFIPFLIIDLVVAAALSSMGMVMLPPVLISLPFKLLLFVAADGWYLVVESLVKSFHGI